MLQLKLYGSLKSFQTGIVITGLFSKQAYFRVIFSAKNRWLIFKTKLILLNLANFQALCISGKENINKVRDQFFP